MKILVCISNVPDTTTKIRLAADGQSIDLAGVQWIINPWDELALSRAVELKEKYPAVVEKVTVINVGSKETEPVVRKALAIGADDAIRINTVPGDAYFVAGQLAAAIKDQAYDIILCGIESSDNNGCAVGAMLAEMLGIPSVSSVSFLDVAEGNICLNREIDGGYEKVQTSVPFVAIVQKGIAIEPKIATVRGIMAARTKPLQVFEPAGIDALTEVAAYELPEAKAKCKMIDAENIGELVDLLHNEAKVI
ncbi:MAG TPA: electron transfer flavoprotein subunit beta/FixA family protein [Bacteroidales bacterium]|mgnify:CR=1 FL=1|nr:electron transfer flavoprotein subunit beta/FixA family protein [Bacteroidales bacterium]